MDRPTKEEWLVKAIPFAESKYRLAASILIIVGLASFALLFYFHIPSQGLWFLPLIPLCVGFVLRRAISSGWVRRYLEKNSPV